MNRSDWRRLWMGMLTVLRIEPRGFFIPYRYAGAVGDTPSGSFEAVHEKFKEEEPRFLDLLRQMDDFGDAFNLIGGASPPAPRWRQDWFPGLDAAVAYTLIRNYRPARIVEIGCGHSTRFFARAVIDGDQETCITAIDPAPRADLSGVGVRFIKSTIQEVISNKTTDVFKELCPGDIFSIDSSHILMPGTDVDILLNRVLPGLPDGVLVHIHDMFLPDDYPSHWAWRSYNEQLGVALLMIGGHYRALWSSHYARSRMQASIDAHPGVSGIHVPEGALESSLWLVKGKAA